MSNLSAFWEKHPETEPSLRHWVASIKAGDWASSSAIQADFPKAKVLNADRVRFPISGGDYRLIVAFDYGRGIAFINSSARTFSTIASTP